MRIELIAIGSELLSGKRLDTNTAYIGRALARAWFEVAQRTTVSDDSDDLARAVADAWARSDAVITCGGLGPTVDDRTREALVAVTGIPLREEASIIDAMRERFVARGRDMPDSNRCQALVPVAGGWFPNAHGTAPGLVFEDGEKALIATPGPPNELCPMVDEQLLPYLQQRYSVTECWLSATFQFGGLPESHIDRDLRELLVTHPNLVVSLLPSLGVIELTLSKRVPTTQALDEELTQVAEQVRAHFGPAVYAEGVATPAEVAGNLLRARGLTLAVAESCTGGLLGGALTAVPGSSDYFVGGVQVYRNEMKTRLLSVEAALFEPGGPGAVSEACAGQMAAGVCAMTGANAGVAITGIAGPGGGTPDKPVGTVWIGVSLHGKVTTRKHHLLGDREEVRRRAVTAALLDLHRALTGTEAV